MKTYEAPRLVDHGDITALTGTLGAPFTGDTSFDIDGNTIETGTNSIDQCPTVDQNVCL